MSLKVWAKELRLPFLALTMIFVPVILSAAWIQGSFHPFNALLTLVGLVSLHASVNVLNDYFDYKSGIDLDTTPTPFSGGSRVLPEKLLRPWSVLGAGLLFLGIGVTVGLFFFYTLSFPLLLILLLAFAVISVVTYSTSLSSWGIGELFVGLSFGPLLAAGVYFVQVGTVTLGPLIIGSALGLLTTGILYVNQFPDTAADKSHGRMHLIARLGKERAAKSFKYILISSYVLIILGVALGVTPPLTLISLVTLPKARSAWIFLERNYNGTMELIPAMGNTVMTTLYTGILLLLSYLTWGFIIYSIP